MNKKLKLIIIFLAIFVASGYYLLFKSEDKSGNTVVDNTFGWEYPVTKFPIVGPEPEQLAYSDIRDPGGIAEGLPVRLKIPAIGVNSAIEDALITPDGKMDVPSGSRNVAWFALGPHPGRTGSAVIGGHFGIRDGVKFVFYDLDKLVVGDKIYIEDDKGDVKAFQVKKIQLFDRNADATTVFTSDDGLAHLNLITCEGIWNRVNDEYPSRRVVFTDAIPTETIPPIVSMSTLNQSVIQAENVTIFYRTLRIGANGADVVSLQATLKEKGFFGTSQNVIDGSFGRITHAAVAKYQTSAGLLSDGIFGPSTRVKLLTELGGDTKLPNAGTDKITIPDTLNDSPSTSQSLIQSFKNLYDTPINGLITSLLLIAIFFMIFKIILQLNVRRGRDLNSRSF